MLHAIAFPQPPPPRGGGLPHRSDRDACRLSLGCKLQILVSLRVFGMRSYYICPFSYCLVLCIKKFTKNVLTLTTQKSPSGVSLSFSHTHIGHPWGFSLNFLLSIPDTFIWESHLPPPPPPRGNRPPSSCIPLMLTQSLSSVVVHQSF